ncbi:TetR family transcriptional regulator [Bifidobacterium sp. ESL0682]|uniref:TetR family transcriptional regulator n=1 Tax=Bifidobacterium sp. ESL0682 TaxID=2983212 RepID=UPI0023F79AA2|nr:TetR family transcriptional regulator [Bifidobacterium sp. ESL0682]WEV42203.1 TetR family transcriptional regulator [Bifidobacterium sp. ESL0682]
MNILSEEQKRERAQRISAAALKLFETRSFGAITMSDIAKAAEVSKGTLFNYFDCKESLFMTLLLDGYQDYFDDLMSEISAQTDFSLHDFAHLLLDSTSKLVRERPSLVRLNALRGPILEHGANMEQTIDHRQKLYDKNQQLATLIADQIPSLPSPRSAGFSLCKAPSSAA